MTNQIDPTRNVYLVAIRGRKDGVLKLEIYSSSEGAADHALKYVREFAPACLSTAKESIDKFIDKPVLGCDMAVRKSMSDEHDIFDIYIQSAVVGK